MPWTTISETEDRPPLMIFSRADIDEWTRSDGLRWCYRKGATTTPADRRRRNVEIVLRFKRGQSRRQIAAELGISYSTVQKVVGD